MAIYKKKTWLAPVLYCIPPLLGLPVLSTIAWVQHFIGLLMIPMVGVIVAKSFVRWRVFIIPITVVLAIDPDLLWFEHVALPETLYVTSVVATALAALLYSETPSVRRLLWMGAALFLVASSRPEGKLFCVFGAALVLVTGWGRWRSFAYQFGIIASVSILSFALNRTTQSGSLLYSNIAHLTPAHLKSAPGFAERHADHFAHLRESWEMVPHSIPHERKALAIFAADYIAGGGHTGPKEVDRFCGRLATEVCLRNAFVLPSLGLAKFRATLNHPAAGSFGSDWLRDKQFDAFTGKWEDGEKASEATQFDGTYSRIVFGREFNSASELQIFLRESYRPFEPDWLSSYQKLFSRISMATVLPARKGAGGTLPGVPVLYFAAVLGLLGLAIVNRLLRSYYLLWLGMLLLMWTVLALTGSNLSRFRIVFEPFLWVYSFALLDVIWAALSRRASRQSEEGGTPGAVLSISGGAA